MDKNKSFLLRIVLEEWRIITVEFFGDLLLWHKGLQKGAGRHQKVSHKKSWWKKKAKKPKEW